MLSDEDRTALIAHCLGRQVSPDASKLVDMFAPAVERIVARAVTAALNEAADAILQLAEADGDGWPVRAYEIKAYAVDIVRNQLRPCRGRNSNVCVAEGCYGGACINHIPT